MAYIDEFLPLMSDDLTITPGTVDVFGEWIPSGEVLVPCCHIEGETRTVRDATGAEVTSSVQVIVGGYFDLTTNRHRYTLPTRFNPRLDLKAIAIDKVSDELGPCYEEVFFK